MNKNKRFYFITIGIYCLLITICMITCFLLKVQGYVYILTLMIASIIFIASILILYYDYLFKVNIDDVETVVKIDRKINIEKLKDDLIKKGFKNVTNTDIYFNIFGEKKLNKKYIYFIESDNFELSLEKFLLMFEKHKLYDNMYFEVYIIIISNYDCSLEVYKEHRAKHLNISNIKLLLNNALIKCINYNAKYHTITYLKNNTYKKSLEAVQFIENDILN